MKLNFWHQGVHLHTTAIEPKEQSAIPKVVFVGAVVFLFDEMTAMADGSVELQYQAQSPLVLPPANNVAQHFFPKKVTPQ